MLSLKSFGVPYLSPLVPGNYQGMKDLVARSPLWWMKKRPAFLFTGNRERVADSTVDYVQGSTNDVLDPLKFKEERKERKER